MTDPKNGRKKCDSKAGRPCNGGRKGGKNDRSGCKEKAGRPCGSKKGKKK
tara:strand:- start:409 stop:558 length:150 start_codon:yes stop_codon:yes gene_type:complete